MGDVGRLNQTAPAIVITAADGSVRVVAVTAVSFVSPLLLRCVAM